MESRGGASALEPWRHPIGKLLRVSVAGSKNSGIAKYKIKLLARADDSLRGLLDKDKIDVTPYTGRVDHLRSPSAIRIYRVRARDPKTHRRSQPRRIVSEITISIRDEAAQQREGSAEITRNSADETSCYAATRARCSNACRCAATCRCWGRRAVIHAASRCRTGGARCCTGSARCRSSPCRCGSACCRTSTRRRCPCRGTDACRCGRKAAACASQILTTADNRVVSTQIRGSAAIRLGRLLKRQRRSTGAGVGLNQINLLEASAHVHNFPLECGCISRRGTERSCRKGGRRSSS